MTISQFSFSVQRNQDINFLFFFLHGLLKRVDLIIFILLFLDEKVVSNDSLFMDYKLLNNNIKYLISN